ncbi:MAG: hypothetical protein ABJC74_16345 [Gemmatimonadota bacterium]
MSQADPVREYLRKSGASHSVISHGLRGLVENWERVVRDLEQGYKLTFDDYLNDMDGRQLLENAVNFAPEVIRAAYRDRIAAADGRVEAILVPSSRCIWGQIVADDEGWRPAKNWWYFRLPKAPGAQMAEELKHW